MYRLLADISFQKDNEFFASMNQETKVEILDYMHSNFSHNKNVRRVACTNNYNCVIYGDSNVALYKFKLNITGGKSYFVVTNASDTVIKKKQALACFLRLNEFHELLPGLGLIEDPGKIRGDGHSVLFLHAAHLHA